VPLRLRPVRLLQPALPLLQALLPLHPRRVLLLRRLALLPLLLVRRRPRLAPRRLPVAATRRSELV